MKSNKHSEFDPDLLNRRKENHSGFTFCPFCRSELVATELDGHLRLACSNPDCDFIFYQNPIPAAGAIIVENDQILMVKRAHPPKIGWWCIPAGFMEWTEHPSQTAIREIREETGLIVELKGFFEVYSGNDDPRNNAILMLYLADRVGGKLQAGDDAYEVKFFSFDQLPEKIAFESHIRAIADYNQRIRKPSALA